MIKNKKIRVFLVLIGIAILAFILMLIAKIGNKENKEAIKIGFIMSGSIEETGWNGMHYKGIKATCDDLGVTCCVKENIGEFTGECEDAIRELVEEGAKMIVLSSYGYSEEVSEIVKEYPDVVFYANSSEYHEQNMTSYFVRIYQARYLSGIIAGLQTKSNCIGYVAAMANNEVNRGINAFTLGVKRVNPEAKVFVKWTDSWNDKEKETEAVEALIQNNQVDVIAYHQNQPNVVDAAEAAGIDSIGYHQAVSGYSDHYLTAVVCNWELMYRELVKEFLSGDGNSQTNKWIGIEKEVVGLSEYSDRVTGQEKEEVERAKTEILEGQEIFSGIIYDREGNLRCSENETISDEVLLEHFDWYVEGVEFSEE